MRRGIDPARRSASARPAHPSPATTLLPQLVELERAERAQEEDVYLLDAFVVEGAVLRCRLGDLEYELASDVDAQGVVTGLRALGAAVRDVPKGFETSVEEPASTWCAWAQLHYDLAIDQDGLRVSGANPRLRLLGIERRGSTALITVGDGATIGEWRKQLGDHVLEGINSELGFAFAARDTALMRFRPA